MESWYRSATDCGQGPYELDLPVAGAKYGEDVELRVHAPHAIAVKVVVEVDGQETARTAFGSKLDNAKCVASAGERLAIARGGGAGGQGGGAPVTGDAVVQQTVVAQLVPAPAPVQSESVIRTRVTGGHVKIRLWSIDPNDLSGVAFGILHVTYAPNVPEPQYEAYLAQLRADQEARVQRLAASARTTPAATEPESVGARRRTLAASRADAERAEREAALAQREAALEAERARARAELEERRRRERVAFCNSHPDDRDCWGAGGRRIHDDLDAHERERAAYCAAHHEDARCWSDDERGRIEGVASRRIAEALRPPEQPSGPPPAARAETPPPKLSLHAEWRPGYWQWTEGQWVWLAGMWRVPDSDIVAEQTTTAPTAPPAIKLETAPPPPVRVAVWVPGFWQWSDAGWVWVAGSWQLRPDTRSQWRPAEWRARGSVHVLLPGGWVHR